MKYPQYVIDYAIDNKISLEEANEHFILNGNNKESEKPLDNFSIEEEEKFLSDLEHKIKMDMADEDWWAQWEKKMAKIKDMEQELGIERDSIITKEEYDWVDRELKEVNKLYDEMYGEDV